MSVTYWSLVRPPSQPSCFMKMRLREVKKSEQQTTPVNVWSLLTGERATSPKQGWEGGEAGEGQGDSAAKNPRQTGTSTSVPNHAEEASLDDAPSWSVG